MLLDSLGLSLKHKVSAFEDALSLETSLCFTVICAKQTKVVKPKTTSFELQNGVFYVRMTKGFTFHGIAL